MVESSIKGKSSGKIRKELEDYFKSWMHKYFQKGIKQAKVIMAENTIIIFGMEFLTLVEQSIIDDDYSKQLIIQTRKKVSDKNMMVLKQNIELISGAKLESVFMDFSIETNTLCMVFVMDQEMGVRR